MISTITAPDAEENPPPAQRNAYPFALPARTPTANPYNNATFATPTPAIPAPSFVNIAVDGQSQLGFLPSSDIVVNGQHQLGLLPSFVDIIIDGQRQLGLLPSFVRHCCQLGFLPSSTPLSTASSSWASFLRQTSSSSASVSWASFLRQHRHRWPATAELPSSVDIVVDGQHQLVS